MCFKRALLGLVLLQCLLLPVFAKETELRQVLATNCAPEIFTHQLFNTESKIAANYVPILALRTFVDGDIYRKKHKVHVERYYYQKSNPSKAYESMIYDVEVRGKGLLGREIVASGTLNEFRFEYRNEINCTITKKASMNASASLDGCEILKIKIESDANTMTNKVEGIFLGREVQYNTNWRETEGLLAGYKYKLHTEGIKNEALFRGFTKGTIGSTSISGEVKEIAPNVYHSEESYGSILVRTDIRISD